MPKRKLTLTVDAAVLDRAREYSRARRTSVSRLVSDYLDSLPRPASQAGDPPEVHDQYPPGVRSLLGIVPADAVPDDARAAYRAYLDEKYGVGLSVREPDPDRGPPSQNS